MLQIHALFIPGLTVTAWKKEYILKASGAFNFDVAQVRHAPAETRRQAAGVACSDRRAHPGQALQGKLFPAATLGNPLPRVLALVPDLKLPAETDAEYRCVTHAFPRAVSN